MNKLGNEELKEDFLQMAESDPTRSKTSRLADIIDEVELAIMKGVKLQAIIERLKGAGLNFTADTLRVARWRIRNRNARSPKRAQKVIKNKEKPAAAPTVAAEANKAQASSQTGPKKFVHNSEPNPDNLF